MDAVRQSTIWVAQDLISRACSRRMGEIKMARIAKHEPEVFEAIEADITTGELGVEEVCKLHGVSSSSLYYHRQKVKAKGVVNARKRELSVPEVISAEVKMEVPKTASTEARSRIAQLEERIARLNAVIVELLLERQESRAK